MIIKCRAALSCINCHSYSGHPIFAKYALGRCFSFSSCAATRVRAPCPTAPGYAPQVWAFSAKAGHAKEENRQRLEGRLPPTAGSLIFRPTRRVGHDFLELQCGKTNLGQLLLRALEEKSAIKPIFDERFAEVAKGNTFQKTHHAIDIPIRHDAMGCLVAANDWQGR